MVVVATSLRWAGTEQTIAGNMRDHEIAFQAAEMGLKACELRLQVFNAKGNGDVSYFYNLHIHPADEYPMAGSAYYWEKPASWEIATAATTLASTAMANAYKGPAIIGSGGTQTGNVTIANVVQEPRCIIENYALEPITTEELVEVAPAYRITSRGLGQRGTILNPATPVFLQSILRLWFKLFRLTTLNQMYSSYKISTNHKL